MKEETCLFHGTTACDEVHCIWMVPPFRSVAQKPVSHMYLDILHSNMHHELLSRNQLHFSHVWVNLHSPRAQKVSNQRSMVALDHDMASDGIDRNILRPLF